VKGVLIFIMLLFVPTSLYAIVKFPVTTCQLLKIGEFRESPEAALFVLIDQSFKTDNNLRVNTNSIIDKWLGYGKYVEVYSFSSAIPGRYLKRITGGRVDDNVREDEIENTLIRSVREDYQLYHNLQEKEARKAVNRALLEVYNGVDERIPYTDIFRSLTEVAEHVKNYKSNNKILLIVSDMLENSTIDSFYSSGGIKNINVENENMMIKKIGMVPDFGNNVTVYIIGLSYHDLGSRNQSGYYDPIKVKLLKEFWRQYFLSSGCKIGEIGSPMIMGILK